MALHILIRMLRTGKIMTTAKTFPCSKNSNCQTSLIKYVTGSSVVLFFLVKMDLCCLKVIVLSWLSPRPRIVWFWNHASSACQRDCCCCCSYWLWANNLVTVYVEYSTCKGELRKNLHVDLNIEFWNERLRSCYSVASNILSDNDRKCSSHELL